MRVLVSVTPASGHLRAVTPLAYALRAAGAEVVVVTAPNLVGVAVARGLSAWPLGPERDVAAELRRALPPGATVLETFGRSDGPDQVVGAAHHYASRGRALAPDLAAFAARWRPDLIVHDPLEYAARLVAGDLGVPAVRLRWAADPYAGSFEAEAVRTLGGCPDPALILDPCPDRLQVPGAPPAQRVRYVPDNGVAVVPDWVLDEPERPRICLCLGNEALAVGGAPAFLATLTALGDVDAEVVAAVTPEARAYADRLDPRVRLAELVPLQLFLDGCALLIHHGGAGCVLSAAALGVPQLVLPDLGDQFANGDRVSAVGVGVTVADPAALRDPDRIGTAIEALLGDPGYRAAAADLRDEIDELPSLGQVAVRLTELAAAA